MNNVHVTIGIPVLNGGKFLAQVLDMLLAQTFRDFEILISDNASDDETPQICREYQKRDSRIRYVRQPVNLGMTENFNYLLSQRKGKYFMFAAVDDQWSPTFLETCVNALEANPDAAIAFPAYVYIDETGKTISSPGHCEYPQNNPLLRFACFAWKYEDHCGYGVMRSESIGNLKLGIWWRPIKNVLHDIVYPFLVGMIARGRVICPSAQPLFHLRLWKHDHAGEHYLPPTYGQYVLLKINVWWASLRAIFGSTRSVWLTAAAAPFLALRALYECVRRTRYVRLAWARFARVWIHPVRIWLEQHVLWHWMKDRP